MADAAAYEKFGRDFLRLVLHKDRVLQSVRRALGPGFELGPIPAGPGRRFAKATARGVYGVMTAEELPGDAPTFRIYIPVDVAFEVDVAGQTLKFHADVVAPLGLTMELADPLTVLWVVAPPTEDDIKLELGSQQKASNLFQKISGLDRDLRAFLIRFVSRELEKPHIKRATHIDLVRVIDGAWPELADQFLPVTDEDRLEPPPELDETL